MRPTNVPPPPSTTLAETQKKQIADMQARIDRLTVELRETKAQLELTTSRAFRHIYLDDQTQAQRFEGTRTPRTRPHRSDIPMVVPMDKVWFRDPNTCHGSHISTAPYVEIDNAFDLLARSTTSIQEMWRVYGDCVATTCLRVGVWVGGGFRGRVSCELTFDPVVVTSAWKKMDGVKIPPGRQSGRDLLHVLEYTAANMELVKEQFARVYAYWQDSKQYDGLYVAFRLAKQGRGRTAVTIVESVVVRAFSSS